MLPTLKVSISPVDNIQTGLPWNMIHEFNDFTHTGSIA